MDNEACLTINVGAGKPTPSVIPTVTPKAPTAWAPVLMSVLAGTGLAVVGMILWPEE